MSGKKVAKAKESIELIQRTYEKLNMIYDKPACYDIAFHLSELKEISDDFTQAFKKILALNPKNKNTKEKADKLLAKIEVELFYHADYHIKGLKKVFKKFFKDVEKKTKRDPSKKHQGKH